MAESLEARICNLILKLLAHTFGRLCALPAAGTVSSGALESFPDGIDNLLIGIELDFHVRHLFLDCGFIIPQDKVFFCDEVTLIKKSGAFGAPDFKKVNYAFHRLWRLQYIGIMIPFCNKVTLFQAV